MKAIGIKTTIYPETANSLMDAIKLVHAIHLEAKGGFCADPATKLPLVRTTEDSLVRMINALTSRMTEVILEQTNGNQ